MTLVIGARTPCVGVAGTILSGGFSWISAERGCISDPENMLDAEVVKHDGSVIWASSEPELLWSLRGGGGGFAGMYQHHISFTTTRPNTIQSSHDLFSESSSIPKTSGPAPSSSPGPNCPSLRMALRCSYRRTRSTPRSQCSYTWSRRSFLRL